MLSRDPAAIDRRDQSLLVRQIPSVRFSCRGAIDGFGAVRSPCGGSVERPTALGSGDPGDRVARITSATP